MSLSVCIQYSGNVFDKRMSLTFVCQGNEGPPGTPGLPGPPVSFIYLAYSESAKVFSRSSKAVYYC